MWLVNFAVLTLSLVLTAGVRVHASINTGGWPEDSGKIDGIIAALTPEEKISLLHGANYAGSENYAAYVNGIPRLGIPSLQIADGESRINDIRDTTAIPSQINVAATWSRSMAKAAGHVTGLKARLLKAGIALAPRVILLRDPFDGSPWQAYSEDTYLNAQLGVEAVRGIQAEGTMANTKQIGPTSSGAMDAGVATMMCSYAQVNGVPSCQHQELMNYTVRGDYGFKGIVMSDWGATHSTAPSIEAGLDWEMGFQIYYADPLYDDVYVHRNLSEAYVDRTLHRILSTYDRFGLIGQNRTALDMVPNPLPQTNITELAVIGPAAFQYNHGAGFAERAYGIPSRLKSSLDAIQDITGNDHILTSDGVDVHGSTIPAGYLLQENGQQGLVRTNSLGETSVDPQINFSGDSALPGNTSYNWAGFLKANETGYYRISLHRRLPHVDGGLNNSDHVDVETVHSFTVNGTAFDGHRLLSNVGTDVYLTAGLHNITVSVTKVFGDPIEVRLNWVTPTQREQNIREAEKIASNVEVPIVFAHSNSPADVRMQLNHGFDELISRLAAINPKTVKVLNNADPVLMPWLDQVSSVLWMVNPGQEGGRATASLLFGDHNPQGKSTITYPQSVNDTVTRNPKYPERMATKSGTAIFSEGINSAYRWYLSTNTSVLFPFGYGLSYTSFKYSNLDIQKKSGSTFQISVHITNTGSRPGVEIPQLYIGPPENAGSKYPGYQFAVSTLVGFDDLSIASGATKSANYVISERQLSFWRQSDRSWVLARRKRSVWVGNDAETRVLVGQIEV
ncbi:hypothetical protein PEBR_01999 [Penicillium brasilianum]|uniref:beta-glucosidase n=1 Tax=Penicillium brasilianum TaxID=104259 RepID=A0A1S9S1A8_PENBI|nr:hypothetical protein PEBR_01999 [Penicillium brasilianum]